MRPFVRRLALGLALVFAAAPAGAASLHLEKIGGLKLGGEGAAEICSFDPQSKLLFVVNAGETAVEVVDLSNPAAPVKKSSISLKEHGGGINSVAVKNGLVAVAVEADPKQDSGKIILMNLDGTVRKRFDVGALPDMVAFTPDGKYVLAACEGEPNKDYSVDPEGSIAVISLAKGVDAATCTMAYFHSFNTQKAQLQAKGVRISHPKATVSQDLEPEYIAVSPDSKTAYVVLQENNAFAVLDVATAKVKDIKPLGMKDWKKAGGLDASDKDKKINIKPWPVHGLYMPDSVAAFAAKGKVYLVTANEGDSRDYDGYSDEARLGKVYLNDRIFPDAKWLTRDKQLGRLKVVKDMLDTDGDGLADRIVAYGARSFSIWNAATGAQVFDSADQFERIIAKEAPEYFNAEEKFDDRSDDKGPEPEGVTVGVVDGRTYAFVGLERQGGLMVYDVTEPAKASFVQYINSRDYAADQKSEAAGDVAPEGVLFIAAKDSPTGQALVVTANEVSGTVAVFAARK
ncbi:choice-of-anchor I family protein [Megalodesulfovibrio gigas]|uniref:Putative alkaline phosphatase n=1 Tax=Megalodesulfovibrio gigas (strain ATCC 19364 / DSM 1382 / NCIMB 9332 / VKM B-1759) TaxID=1121448 RepID=T2GBX7_MEGG1|nr:choice-of-anchor I family protein [Megalodesulfovibrio gigas]AGW13595.1 putative alkaline phosphatase [Megalodesulfovibrio gigas DSM 1382 = ATCC 19364]AGW13674.1 putative alkaline phosphatase-like protein [Megalodesulfovibrio gigas DSM 1382 = ATCC 19364]